MIGGDDLLCVSGLLQQCCASMLVLYTSFWTSLPSVVFAMERFFAEILGTSWVRPTERPLWERERGRYEV